VTILESYESNVDNKLPNTIAIVLVLEFLFITISIVSAYLYKENWSVSVILFEPSDYNYPTQLNITKTLQMEMQQGDIFVI
jgi:LPS O-antigen subunit length determinant protein (WzzB/FepE family)